MDPFKASGGAGFSIPGLEGLELNPRRGEAPLGTKPKSKNPRATFLGSDALPGQASANMGGKTLMGQ